KRRPCSARNSCELWPTWLMPVFFASTAASAAGDSATAALVPSGTGFDVTSSIVPAPFASDRRDSIGGGMGGSIEMHETGRIDFDSGQRRGTATSTVIGC